jgi:hypothetical protein
MFALIVSFMDAEFQLALAHTCKNVYSHYKEKCRKETVAFLCSPPSNLHSNDQYRKVLERCPSEAGGQL